MIFSSAVRTLFWVAALLIVGSVLTSIFAIVVENRMVAVSAAGLMAAGFLAGVAWLDRANGDKYWYLNGKRHREDGPAIEWADGSKSWWLNGEKVTEEEVIGNKEEPTMETNIFGTKRWLLNGKIHREDGPAIEFKDGYKAWCLNGKRHREDGPAVEYADGTKFWWLNGERVTEEEHKRRTSKATCEGKVVEIEGVKYELKEV